MPEVVIGTIEEGLSWVGKESDEYISDDRVEVGAIRRYCELVEDGDPRYWEDSADPDGRDSTEASVLAPPASLLIWCMPPVWRPGRPVGSPPHLHRRVPLPGQAVVALQATTDFFHPIRAGDRLRYREQIESITPKRTRIGDGSFIVTLQRYRNQRADHVADNRLTIFRFDGGVADGEAPPGPRMRPSKPDTTGEIIGAFSMKVTRERMMLDVVGTRDFNPIHYDVDFANRNGYPDVLLNTPVYQGLFARLVSEWTSDPLALRSLTCEMIAPNFPGDTMHVAGWVQRHFTDADGQWTEIALSIENDRCGLTTRGIAVVPSIRSEADRGA